MQIRFNQIKVLDISWVLCLVMSILSFVSIVFCTLHEEKSTQDSFQEISKAQLNRYREIIIIHKENNLMLRELTNRTLDEYIDTKR